MPRQRSRELPEGLFKRGPVYVFRRAIPPELRAKIGRREVFLSLGTTDELEARIRGAVELVRSEQLFHEARESLLLDEAAAGLWERIRSENRLRDLAKRTSSPRGRGGAS